MGTPPTKGTQKNNAGSFKYRPNKDGPGYQQWSDITRILWLMEKGNISSDLMEEIRGGVDAMISPFEEITKLLSMRLNEVHKLFTEKHFPTSLQRSHYATEVKITESVIKKADDLFEQLRRERDTGDKHTAPNDPNSRSLRKGRLAKQGSEYY